jgi:hypothetical protein
MASLPSPFRLAVIALAAAACARSSGALLPVGAPAPTFTVTAHDAKSTKTLSSHRGSLGRK